MLVWGDCSPQLSDTDNKGEAAVGTSDANERRFTFCTTLGPLKVSTCKVK